MKRKALRRTLAQRQNLHPIRIALLGGSTANEFVDLLEILLLEAGFSPTFHQSEYGRYFVDAVHDSDALIRFKPDIVYVHTSVMNVERFPAVCASESEFEKLADLEFARFQQIWSALERKLGCTVIQNNFELPPCAILGNLDASAPGGRTRFIHALNERFARAAAATPRLLLQDVCSLSARLGLETWFDPTRWFSYKIVTSPQASYALATSLCAILRALYGRSRKVLVLDLDNTLWGGVIGDDGLDGIQIGRETALAEAYTAFQQYCLSLRDRGILLAVCSKNDEAIARQGFSHPDSVLSLEHISCFRASWDPKPDSIAAIARELNLSPDSFVFVDDNPAERALVAAQVEGIAVPEMGSDPARFPAILEAGRYFEPVSLSHEDTARAGLYRQNAERAIFESSFADYGQYLDSLDMSAEIEPFTPVYLDRITQLTNKTNQFNLTTRRYTLAEMHAVLADPNAIGLYGRLTDRFGDNGLVSVVLAHRRGSVLEIDLWLMSCRVLKRDMELAMLDSLVERARLGILTLEGRYVPTPKNRIVRDHYATLGFQLLHEHPDGSATYSLPVEGYKPRNTHIRIPAQTHTG
ncbi:MAG: HAD-IIIC family phosphatase [Acidobacteriota bacterium]|nr:HAD-IIIC family phosphatase [Acidobacteriota bacterium]